MHNSRDTSPKHMGALVVLAVLTACAAGSAQPHLTPTSASVQEHIAATERQRLRALVEADIDLADSLHADDFQLINPLGEPLSKRQYLDGIASGRFDYIRWEPGEMIVRVYGNAAVLRYRSMIEIAVDGQRNSQPAHWSTDVYEERDGRWQVVWSHATTIR